MVGFLVFGMLKFQHLCLWSWSIHSKGGIIAKKSFQLSKPQKPSFIRASTLVEEKIQLYSTYKSHFIYFNLPFHNSLHINVLIFPSELNTIHLFIIFSLSYSLSLSSSLFLLRFFNLQPPLRHNQTTTNIMAQPNHNHHHSSLKVNQKPNKKKKIATNKTKKTKKDKPRNLTLKRPKPSTQYTKSEILKPRYAIQNP